MRTALLGALLLVTLAVAFGGYVVAYIGLIYKNYRG